MAKTKIVARKNPSNMTKSYASPSPSPSPGPSKEKTPPPPPFKRRIKRTSHRNPHTKGAIEPIPHPCPKRNKFLKKFLLLPHLIPLENP